MFIAEARRIKGGWLCRDEKSEEFFLTQTQLMEELKKYEERLRPGTVIRTETALHKSSI